MPDATLKQLATSILDGMQLPAVAELASANLLLCRSLGLVSDWDACPQKVIDFSRLCAAAAGVLPDGGSIETGVFRGGTSGVLALCASPNSFHVSIDPYGLLSQSYDSGEYVQWADARQTTARLSRLCAERFVTSCHYFMAATDFIRADHLSHPHHFRIIHLDGDHSHHAVVEELGYFKRKVKAPALFVLDDHDEHFPGVESGLKAAGGGLVPVLHRTYDFPNYGPAGFSAWLFGG